MGFFIRKAFSFGPLRINLSKSGLGLSAGVKGLRVGVKPSGKAYLAGGREGLYFRENLGQIAGDRGTGAERSATVEGRALNPQTDSPLAGVEVKLILEGEESQITTTDASGRFRFVNLPPKPFKLFGALPMKVLIDEKPAFAFLPMWLLVAVGLFVVLLIALAIDGDFKGPGRVRSPLGQMNYDKRPESTYVAPAPTELPVAPPPLAPAEQPTPLSRGTITMHGRTIKVK